MLNVSYEIMCWFEVLLIKSNGVWIQLYDRPFITTIMCISISIYAWHFIMAIISNCEYNFDGFNLLCFVFSVCMVLPLCYDYVTHVSKSVDRVTFLFISLTILIWFNSHVFFFTQNFIWFCYFCRTLQFTCPTSLGACWETARAKLARQAIHLAQQR